MTPCRLSACSMLSSVEATLVGGLLPLFSQYRTDRGMTSSCAGKIGLREPGEHTSVSNLASRDNVAHKPNLYTILEPPPRLTRFIERRPGHTLSDAHMLSGGQPFRPPLMSALPPKADSRACRDMSALCHVLKIGAVSVGWASWFLAHWERSRRRKLVR